MFLLVGGEVGLGGEMVDVGDVVSHHMEFVWKLKNLMPMRPCTCRMQSERRNPDGRISKISERNQGGKKPRKFFLPKSDRREAQKEKHLS